jgi:NAD-dependent dihydropyrimidine dehydrogenase PreA subunit
MTYVIGKPCVDVMDRACVEECPVDCIYEGGRALYIHPDECVDCGACEPVCPVEAIYYGDDLSEDLQPYQADNATFFFETLPGRDEALGSPGGAAKMGQLGVDTPLVASLPKQDSQRTWAVTQPALASQVVGLAGCHRASFGSLKMPGLSSSMVAWLRRMTSAA